MNGSCHRATRQYRLDSNQEDARPTTPARQVDPRFRAGDQDRDRVNAALGDAFAEGYLTLPEFEQRSEQVLQARTMGDLQPLTADLPTVQRAEREQKRAAQHRAARLGVRAHVLSYAVSMVIMIGIWLVTAIAFDATYFWPIWPALGWGIGVASHALPVLRSTAVPALPRGRAPLPR